MGNRKKAPTEFTAMQAFVDALPSMDDNAILALAEWIGMRGEAEIKLRAEKKKFDTMTLPPQSEKIAE